jgi:hypothetical protein
MRYLKSINELYKSPGYLNRISTPDSETGDINLSRFVEWTPKYTQGWELMGMHEVDEDGYELSDRYIAIDKFIFEQNLSDEEINTIKLSITAALGQIGNAKWIDGFKFEYNKANAIICLGKLGLIFKNRYYTPVFRISKREGSLFWIVADFYKGNQIARSIMVTKSDISNHELERNSIEIQNAHYRKEFEEENKERRKEGKSLLLKPKEVKDERNFVNQLSIVRDTGEKQFFVIYIDISKYDRIQFAKKMTGADITLESPRTVAVKTSKKREYVKSGNYFYFDVNNDPKYKYLLAKNKDYPEKLKEVKDLGGRMKVILYEETPGVFKYATIKNIAATAQNLKSNSLTLILSANKVEKILKLESGVKLRIPVLNTDYTDRFDLFEVEVGKVDPKDKKKIPVIRIQK